MSNSDSVPLSGVDKHEIHEDDDLKLSHRGEIRTGTDLLFDETKKHSYSNLSYDGKSLNPFEHMEAMLGTGQNRIICAPMVQGSELAFRTMVTLLSKPSLLSLIQHYLAHLVPSISYAHI